MSAQTDYGFTFDEAIADELSNRWLMLDLVVARIPGSRERDVVALAIADLRRTELRLLDSVRPCPEMPDVLPCPEFDLTALPVSSAPAPTPPAPVVKGERRSFTDEEKADAVRLVANIGRKKASDRLGIGVSVLGRWVNAAMLAAAGATPVPPPTPPPARPAPSLVDHVLKDEPDEEPVDVVSARRHHEAEMGAGTRWGPQRPIPRQSFDPARTRGAAATAAFTEE